MKINPVQPGVDEILEESLRILSPHKVTHMMVGGRGVFARYPGQHPGTLDVDILFQEGTQKNALKEVIESFLGEGYTVSAKHSFQLIKIREVGGLKLAFNVDFLHPSIEKKDMVEFVDHLELDVTRDVDYVKKVCTIVMPGAEILFKEKLFENIELFGHRCNLISDTGTVFSKLQSCQSQKRPRDIFDIHIAIVNSPATIAHIQSLASNYEAIAVLLDGLRKNWNKNQPYWINALDDYGVADPGAALAQVRKLI